MQLTWEEMALRCPRKSQLFHVARNTEGVSPKATEEAFMDALVNNLGSPEARQQQSQQFSARTQFWALGSGLWAPGSGLRAPGSGLRAPGSGLWALLWEEQGQGKTPADPALQCN